MRRHPSSTAKPCQGAKPIEASLRKPSLAFSQSPINAIPLNARAIVTFRVRKGLGLCFVITLEIRLAPCIDGYLALIGDRVRSKMLRRY